MLSGLIHIACNLGRHADALGSNDSRLEPVPQPRGESSAIRPRLTAAVVWM